MVSNFMQFVTSCLPTSHKYAPLEKREDKKDDDYLARRVEEWKSNFPVTDALAVPFFDHKSYTKKLIKEMILIPVNETTAPHIAAHLYITAKKSPFIADDLLREIADCKDNKFTSTTIKTEIYTRVCLA